MAKKLSHRVKKSSAKAKPKGATKAMADGCAKRAWKRGAKSAQSTKRTTGKPAKRRKDYPPHENGGEANGAYGVVTVDEETSD